MLRITMSVSGEGATKYFDAALATSKYYGSERGQWGGKGAERLGLHGDVSRKDFIALASNKRPGTDETLTVRMKTTRKQKDLVFDEKANTWKLEDGEVSNRRAGYDFCFSVPKSVSLYLVETGDRAVEQLIHQAFKETMVDIENRMETRVRGKGDDGQVRNEERTTGNLIYASFVHTETRPIDGIPDPHYHIHAFTFNATYDPEEERWKAGEFGNIKRDAPSSSGVEILKQQGFATLDTFQKLMDSVALQDVARGKIVWIDEVGFLSTRQMRWAVDFAARNDCRLILSGDTRQHHAVDRGDAMRLMEQTGAVVHMALTKIFRQQIAALREAVYDLSAGKTESGFSKLDAFGAIHEIEENAQRLEAIANQHIAAIREGKSSLIVVPTHTECRAIAEVVRGRQKKEGFLSGEEHATKRLEKVNLTESQRRDAINYNRGHVVEFHRRAKGGFKSGERWEVGRCASGTVVVVKDGQAKILPLAQAKSFNVYTQEEVAVAVGDTLRITKNFRVGTSRFRNNELCTVTAIHRESITVGGGRVDKTFRAPSFGSGRCGHEPCVTGQNC